MSGEVDRRESQPDWEALARHLAGEDAHVDPAVAAWLAAHPEEAARIEALDKTIRQFAAAPTVDVEAALRRVPARRNEPAVVPLRRLEPFMRPRRYWRPALLAAAAVIAVVLGTLVWRGGSTTPKVTIAQEIG